MIITIPDKVSWRKTIGTDSFSHYNKTNAKRILKTFTHQMRDEIAYTIETLTRDHLAWFEPMYVAKIAQKDNPQIINLYETTLNKVKRDFKILIITESEVKLGAIIFSENATEVNISYKIFADTWNMSTLPAGPSLYADFLLTEHAARSQKITISHGKDRNGYGMTSSIGLAIFKISLGYKPYLPKKYEFISMDDTQITKDSLYFTVTSEDSSLVGNLYTTKDTQHQWERLNSYKDQVVINWIIR
ncbi:MAG: hypothetical protein V4668_00075 [Patescibacteria group bacterium]